MDRYDDNYLVVKYPQLVKSVTEGQQAVVYDDDGKVLLAGVIEKTFINGKWHKQMLFERIHGE